MLTLKRAGLWAAQTSQQGLDTAATQRLCSPAQSFHWGTSLPPPPPVGAAVMAVPTFLFWGM